MIGAFPNNIVTRKTKPRFYDGAMDDAVIDMFLLSRCKEIYGSSNSTFDEVASYIGGKRLNVVKV